VVARQHYCRDSAKWKWQKNKREKGVTINQRCGCVSGGVAATWQHVTSIILQGALASSQGSFSFQCPGQIFLHGC